MINSGEILGHTLVVHHHNRLLHVLVNRSRRRRVVWTRARAGLCLGWLDLLANVILVYDKPSALHHRPRHFEVLGSQIEVREEGDEVGGQHATHGRVDGYLAESEASVLHGLADDLVEASAGHLELAVAEIDNAFVQAVHNFQIELLTALLPRRWARGERYLAELHLEVADKELLPFVIE